MKRWITACCLAATLSAQSVQVQPAPLFAMPGEADSNSPAHWRNGIFYLYNSNGMPVRSIGMSALHLGATRAVLFDDYTRVFRWIESTWVDDDGTVYAWYHHEPGTVCSEAWLTAPQIGALVSHDGGSSFFDLGIVIDSGAAPDCNARNGYFAGGTGDFSVMLDREGQYFYFLFGHYGGDVSGQGVAVARMAFEDRTNPVGRVWKYHRAGWEEPGLGGEVTPVFPARASWADPFTDSFWGPSIHWNHYLEKWVMLLNRSCCSPGWPQEGIYISYSDDLSNPLAWSEPVKILDGVGWYPQVLGFDYGESDKLAGQNVRLFVGGYSLHELLFER